MKLEKQKKWGQPLDYSPDFYAIEDEKEDHVAEQYINMWDWWFKVLLSVPAVVVLAIVLYAIVIYWLNYYL